MSTNLNNSLEALFGKMENFISTKTVVGEAIHVGDVTMLPLVDVSFGVGAGASDADKEKDKKEFTGGGMGGKITPSAVLVIANGTVQLVNIRNQDSISKLIDMAPGLLSKLNLGSIFGDKEKEENNEDETKEDYGVTTE